MKIVYFNYLYDIYGVSIGSTIKAKELLSELQKIGHEVKIYWRKRQPENSNGFKKKTKNLLKKRLAKYLHDLKQLLSNVKYIFEENKILTKEKPDLIIARLDLYLFSAILLSKLRGIPIIIEADAPCVYEAREFHPEYLRIGGLDKIIEKINLKYSNLNFCVSNEARDFFSKYGISPKRLPVITNGANTERFFSGQNRSVIRNRFQLNGKIVVGFVGSFHYWHGIDNLKALIHRTLALNDKTIFMLVGDGGPMKSVLDDYINEEKLQNRVVSTGYVPYHEIPEYISAMDLVLAPYPNLRLFYYSPVKIFEYMACEKPIVTTEIGQIAEIITDGYNGFLCKPDNIDAMFNKVTTLVGNPTLRKRIGRNARKTIIQHHSWRKKAVQLSEICEDVISAS